CAVYYYGSSHAMDYW
nr:immunoglobulin heavy chain junction region [Mus musculus]